MKLKPCPFCGGNAMVVHGKCGMTENSRIYCMRCGAKTDKVPISLKYCADDEAADLWNSRYWDDE